MQYTMMALAAVLALTGPEPEAVGQDPGVVERCSITIKAEADVPAEQDGKLMEVMVVEGQQVNKGDLLGRIDDRMAIKQKEVAQYKLDAARAEADNEVNIKYATASHEVAIAEHEQMVVANRTQPNTFPALEVRRAALTVKQTDLQIDQARHEQKLAALKANIQQGELDAAILDVEYRKILAPFSGQVVERYRDEGEWVRPGDPVLHLVRLDCLRVKATLDGTKIAPSEVDGKPVTVEVALAHRTEKFAGKVVNISPQRMAGNKFEVWAEVYNRQENDRWLLGYNMDARMIIHWRQ